MSIPEIVEKSGWETFRNIESEVANEVGRLDNCIIDAGGGIILKKINYNNLKRRVFECTLKNRVTNIREKFCYSDDLIVRNVDSKKFKAKLIYLESVIDIDTVYSNFFDILDRNYERDPFDLYKNNFYRIVDPQYKKRFYTA